MASRMNSYLRDVKFLAYTPVAFGKMYYQLMRQSKFFLVLTVLWVALFAYMLATSSDPFLICPKCGAIVE